MYFVLGMLSIIGAAFVATIVWGIVKITKLIKTIKQQEEWISNNDRNIWETFNHRREDIDREFGEIHRRIDREIQSVRSDIDVIHRHAEKNLEGLERETMLRLNDQITDSVTQSNSYTDKRIDKLIDTYFDVKEAKKLIKG